ncbi:MAG: dihydrodipicolinate synthase family protein [Caulobacterales bacterium]|nr:dihydrodipicolinate synthase family protein [Caulobacterales bacterium]
MAGQTAADRRARAQAFTISITPFDAEGRLDEPAIRRHLARLGASGIGVYVGGGGSGEGYTLAREETQRLLEIAVDELKGKTAIRAMGVEPRTAAEMIAFLEMAKAAGVDAAQVYSLDVGHGHAPTPDELEVYFTEVLTAVDMPLVLSTHQSVGYVIPADVIVALYRRFPQLIALNCSHQDPTYLRALVDGLGETTDIFVGGPHNALTALAFGAQGFLTSEGNLAPRLCMSVIEAYRNDDLTGLMEAWSKLMRLFVGLYGNGGIRVTKAVLNQLGLAGGYPRKPRLPVTDARLTRAMAVVESLDLAALEGW